jgi:hypothetical protein
VILSGARKDSRLAAQQRANELEELSAEEDETPAFMAYPTVAFRPRVRRLLERLDVEASHVTSCKDDVTIKPPDSDMTDKIEPSKCKADSSFSLHRQARIYGNFIERLISIRND